MDGGLLFAYSASDRCWLSWSVCRRTVRSLRLFVPSRTFTRENVRREHVVANVLALPTPVLHSVEYTGEESRDAIAIAKSLHDVISSVGEKKISAVVTDNAPAMRAAWSELVDRFGHKDIFFFGCASHITNLVLHDIFSKDALAARLLTDSSTLAEFFKKRDQLYSALRKNAEGPVKSFSSAVPTRWWSQVSLLESVLALKKAIRQTILDEDMGRRRVPTDLRQTALDVAFWTAVEELTNFTRPFARAIKIFEKDDPRLSNVFLQYTLLSSHSATSTLPYGRTALEALRERFRNLLDVPEKGLVETAFLLDPRHMNYACDSTVVAVAIEWMQKRCPAAVPSFMMFRSRLGFFSSPAIWTESVVNDPLAWYKTLVRPSFQDLSDFACKILSIPASSAAVERVWSIFGHLHSATRNRITDERAAKLLYVKVNLSLLPVAEAASSESVSVEEVEGIDEGSETGDSTSAIDVDEETDS
jgi:hypothetical protein